MTAQQIFDKVWQTFVVEKAPKSVNEAGKCVYGHPDTIGCAVACLMPRETRQALYEYENKTTSLSVTLLSREIPGEYPAWVDDNIILLRSLQSVHDNSSDLLNIESGMRDIAAEFGLAIPEVAA
jgi:hypothetical protein